MTAHSAGKTTGQPKSVRTVAIIPAHDEERFIGSVVLQVRQYVDTVIVVDDGSTDDTAAVATAAGATVVRHERNLGKGAALSTGFAAARKLSPQAAVVMDADGQHRAAEIPTVLQPVLDGSADMVVGSRFLDKSSPISLLRRLGMHGLTMASNVGSGVRVTDSQTGFRAFSRRAVDTMSFRSNGFSVESEMQFVAKQLDLKVMEVSIAVGYHDAPKRSMVSQGLEVLNGILNLMGQHRPLLFFGLPGLIVLLVGLAWGYYVTEIYRRAQVLALGYALISVLLSILGSLSLFAGIILHSVRALLMDYPWPERGADAPRGREYDGDTNSQ